MPTLFKKRKKLDLELKLYLTNLVQNILNDPEYFSELREEVKKKLQSLRKNKGKTISFEKIKKKYLNE